MVSPITKKHISCFSITDFPSQLDATTRFREFPDGEPRLSSFDGQRALRRFAIHSEEDWPSPITGRTDVINKGV